MGINGAGHAFHISNAINFVLIFVYIAIKNPLPESVFWFTKNSFKGIWEQFKDEIIIGSTIIAASFAEELYSLLSGTLGKDESAAFLSIMATLLTF